MCVYVCGEGAGGCASVRVNPYDCGFGVWADACVCLCASLAQHPGQGEGLILCGLKRINFVLTLAGCGLHPYPPLFSVPGAKQRRRQASRDGEYERESYCTRRREREGLCTVSKKCHFRKRLLFALPLYISIL